MRMRLYLLWAMLGAYGLAALLGVVAALSQDMGAIRLLLTSLLLGVSFTACFLLALLAERGRRTLRWLMFAGFFTAVPASGLWLVLIWTDFRGFASEDLARIMGGLTFATLWVLYVGYCFCMRIRYTWPTFLMIGLFVFSIWFIFLLEMIVIDDDIVEFIARRIFGSEDNFGRVLVAMIILFVAGSLALPIIWLIGRVRSDGDAVLGSRVEVDLTCPRCELAQKIQVGNAYCERCRLEIRIKIEEPHCACGFLLYRFVGDTCPECGRGVSKDLCWNAEPS